MLTHLRPGTSHSSCQRRPFPRTESLSTSKDSSPRVKVEVDSEVAVEDHQEVLQEAEPEDSEEVEEVELQEEEASEIN